MHFSKQQYKLQKTENRKSTWAIFGTLIALFAITSYLFGGLLMVFLTLGFLLMFLTVFPQATPNWILKFHKAQEISPGSPNPFTPILAELAKRADFETLPRLYYIPSRAMIAFAAGSTPNKSFIALSDGIIRRCNQNELAGVLAHEISHIKNGDNLLLGTASAFAKLTTLLSQLGLILLFINIPWLLYEASSPPWWVVVILFLTPIFSTLLQFALSRNREFEADLDAAALTGNPRALASALRKVDSANSGFWARVLVPYKQNTWTNTHPPTPERIKRLLALEHNPFLMRSPRQSVVVWS